MIVPFQPGGAADFIARIIQPKLGQELHQTIVIDNRPGASGSIGVEVAANAAPDGHTILLGNVGTMAINSSVFPRFRPKPLDAFIAVTQVADVPGGLAVHPSVPVHSLKEFIDYARARPGKLSYSTSGAGSDSRLAMEYFMKKAGLNIVMINYKGGAGAAVAGLTTGETQAAMLSTPSILPFVRQGRLRLLAVTAPRRLDTAPDTPTMAESGFPDITTGLWLGMYVAKGAPKAVVSRLFTSVTNTMRDPEVGRRLATASAAVVLSKSPGDFHNFWKQEHDRWARVVNDIGAVAQE
ncbi:MAG: tripartite tricarboxylate transporter substrate binding protein [Pseudomonadota bacterium]